jgi:hypothetical protein
MLTATFFDFSLKFNPKPKFILFALNRTEFGSLSCVRDSLTSIYGDEATHKATTSCPAFTW